MQAKLSKAGKSLVDGIYAAKLAVLEAKLHLKMKQAPNASSSLERAEKIFTALNYQPSDPLLRDFLRTQSELAYAQKNLQLMISKAKQQVPQITREKAVNQYAIEPL